MNSDEILVLGNGFLGSCYKRNGYEVWGRDDFGYPYNVEKFEAALASGKYTAVVNTIGISNTRFCEDSKNWNLIKLVNGNLPSYLSSVCNSHGVTFCHISTGCTYDQKDGVVTEDSLVASHCRYVVSKLIGEYGCDVEKDIIIRPRLLFDSERVVGKRNNLLQKFEMFDTFLNEFNTVTSNQVIVDSTKALLDNNCVGVYNCGCLGAYTIKQMAEALGFECKKSMQDFELRSSEGLYLVNNVMSMDKLIFDTGYTPPDAIDELKNCYEILKNS